jgi:hypothetical protein
VVNQGTVAFDGDGNGTNESSAVTDDPAVGGAEDPTEFVVGGSAIDIPTLSEVGLLALMLLLAAIAVVMLGRRRTARG